MNIARDTRIATYVFSEPANFLLYYNNIRTDPSLRRFSSSFHGRYSLFLSLLSPEKTRGGVAAIFQGSERPWGRQ